MEASHPILSQTVRRWPQSRSWPRAGRVLAGICKQGRSRPPAESPQARTHCQHHPEDQKERKTLWLHREPRGGAGDSRVQTHTRRWIRGAAKASSEQTLSTYLRGTVAALWRQACRMAAAGTARNKMLTKTGRRRLPRGGGWPAKARYARPVEVGAAQEA